MFPNILGLLCAACAVVAFALAHRKGRTLSRVRRAGWLAVAGLLSLPALYNAAHYLHVLPETAWFYEARSWRGVEWLVVPAGLAGGLLAACLPRRLLVLPLFLTIAVAWGPFLKPVFGPLDDTTLHDTWVRDICIQSTFSTCGPASTATIFRALGVESSEAAIARAAHTYQGGTEAWYLARHVRAQGLVAHFTLGAAGFPHDVRLPAIVGATIEGRGHFIPVLGRDGDAYLVGDPVIGPERLTLAQLEARYGFTGFALEISRR